MSQIGEHLLQNLEQKEYFTQINSSLATRWHNKTHNIVNLWVVDTQSSEAFQVHIPQSELSTHQLQICFAARCLHGVARLVAKHCDLQKQSYPE